MTHPLIRQTALGLNDKNRLGQFLILGSFGLTFVFARVVVHLQNTGQLPTFVTNPHIHHLVPGIFLSLVSGYLGLAFFNIRRLRLAACVGFGIGAALTLDEFALWLNLRDVYFEEAGRRSIDVVIVSVTLLAIIFLVSEAHDHRWFPFKNSKA